MRLYSVWLSVGSMTFVASPRIRSRSGAYTRIGAFTHPTPRIRICACTRWWVRIRGWVRIRAPGCVYAGRCVYASGGCVYAAGAYMHPGVYTRVGAYTRTVGVYTQGVCIRTPSRIHSHRFLRIRTPDTVGHCVYAGIDEP